MDEKLKELLEKAQANFNEQREKNEALTKQIADLQGKLDTVTEQMKNGVDAGQLQTKMEDLVEEISDLRSKYRAPASVITDDQQKKAIHEVVMKSFGAFMKKNKGTQGDVVEGLTQEIENQVKTLNLSTPAQGGYAVMEVLSMDVLDHAREFSPIVQQIMLKSDMTRDYRQLIKITYPSIAEGIEAVAGTVPAETSTQTYAEVKSKVFKLYAQPRITNEALYGADINVYQDLITTLGEEIGIYLAAQILYGDGTDLNARGILSSNRVDITDGTGKSWLPTLTPTGVGARPSDYFPALGTGVSGDFGADDVARVNFLIDAEAALPTRYLVNAKWYMNRKTLARWKKVRFDDGKPALVWDYIDGTRGRVPLLNGYPVVVDDTMPDVAANSTPMIFGDLSRAFAYAPGDIDQMLLDPYTKKGNLIVYVEKNFTEMIQRSDAIIIVACTTNDGA
jgi:HK97 family phage major capsid protein